MLSRVVLEPLVGATGDSVAFVSLDGRRVAEASCDRADQSQFPSQECSPSSAAKPPANQFWYKLIEKRLLEGIVVIF